MQAQYRVACIADFVHMRSVVSGARLSQRIGLDWRASSSQCFLIGH